MGYLHIDNLYKAQDILAFRMCYALEKIHGTSAHVSWRDGKVGFFSGGESYERFVKVFNAEQLAEKFAARFLPTDEVVVYGEAYGGKQQQMSQTYGTELRFVAFDVKVGESWLDVRKASEFVWSLGLEFVDYAFVSTDVESLDAERDKPSSQAIRNGIVEPKIREGVVLRPPFEVTLNNGHRLIAKHKREEFAERGRPKVDLDPSKRELLEAAESIATEWVTPMRLQHVIDQLIRERDDKELSMSDTGKIIALMIADVEREAHGEVLWSDAAKKACGRQAALLFKRQLTALTPAPSGAGR